MNSDFLAPRRCLREPISEIFSAAEALSRAIDAHLSGDQALARNLLRDADMPEVRAFTESLWGSKQANPDQWKYLRVRDVPGAPPYLSKEQRAPERMPSTAEKAAIVARYGRCCVFCGVPLIRKEVSQALQIAYPDLRIWGKRNKNSEQHAALQCMWLQFDHVLPHSRGGNSSPENLVVTCAPCNYGRWHHTLEENGLIDPRTRPIKKSTWDGLERLLA